MAIMNPAQLEELRKTLIANFEDYKTQVSDGLGEVSACLSRGEFHQATVLMSTISSHQAKASINLRAVLVKQGLIARERED